MIYQPPAVELTRTHIAALTVLLKEPVDCWCLGFSNKYSEENKALRQLYPLVDYEPTAFGSESFIVRKENRKVAEELIRQFNVKEDPLQGELSNIMEALKQCGNGMQHILKPYKVTVTQQEKLVKITSMDTHETVVRRADGVGALWPDWKPEHTIVEEFQDSDCYCRALVQSEDGDIRGSITYNKHPNGEVYLMEHNLTQEQ